MKINAEIEPVYILGNFSVNPVEKGWEIDEPSANLYFQEAGRLKVCHFTHGVLHIVKNLILRMLKETGKLHWVNGMVL